MPAETRAWGVSPCPERPSTTRGRPQQGQGALVMSPSSGNGTIRATVWPPLVITTWPTIEFSRHGGWSADAKRTSLVQYEWFGEERLRRVIRDHRHLPVEEIGRRLEEAVADFENPSSEYSDDRTLIVIKFQ